MSGTPWMNVCTAACYTRMFQDFGIRAGFSGSGWMCLRALSGCPGAPPLSRSLGLCCVERIEPLGHLRNSHQMGSPQGHRLLKLPCCSPRKILLTLICRARVSPGWAALSPRVTIPDLQSRSVSALGREPAC